MIIPLERVQSDIRIAFSIGLAVLCMGVSGATPAGAQTPVDQRRPVTPHERS